MIYIINIIYKPHGALQSPKLLPHADAFPQPIYNGFLSREFQLHCLFDYWLPD